MFVLQPLVSVVLTAVWLAVSKLTKKASIGSIAIIVLLPVGAALVGAPAWEICAIVALGVLVLARHIENIKRLIRREELALGKNQ